METSVQEQVKLVSDLSQFREGVLNTGVKEYLLTNINKIGLTSFAYLSQIYSQQTYGPLIERKIIDLFPDWDKLKKSDHPDHRVNGHVPTGDAITKDKTVIEIKTSFYHDGSKSYCNFVQMRKNSVDFFLLLSFNFSELNKLESKIASGKLKKEDMEKKFKDFVNIAYFPAKLLDKILLDANISSHESHTGIKDSLRVSLTNSELATTIEVIKKEIHKPENNHYLEHSQKVYYRLKNEILESNLELFNHFHNINFLDKDKIIKNVPKEKSNSELIKAVQNHITKKEDVINKIITKHCSELQQNPKYLMDDMLIAKTLLIINRNNPVGLMAIKTKNNLDPHKTPNFNTVLKTEIWTRLNEQKQFSNNDFKKVVTETINKLIEAPLEVLKEKSRKSPSKNKDKNQLNIE